METTILGEARFPSPIHYTVDDRIRIPAEITCIPGGRPQDEATFELAGPRSRIFFDPKVVETFLQII